MEDALPYIRNNIQHFKVREPTVLAGSIFRACASISLLVVQTITTVKGFSNSCHCMVSVKFHQSCPGFDGMRAIENASRHVLFEQRIFL